MRTRVKICGITRVEDALAAVEAGVDAIGLVFVPRSPRHVTPAQAEAIARSVPAFVTVTGLFADPEPDAVEAVLATVPLGLLQFHGRELPDDCRRYGIPYVKATGMADLEDFDAFASDYDDAAGLLLDSHRRGEMGGTGQTFDWRRFPRAGHRAVILAGGLGPENVAEAIRTARPYAVDLSSGVESAPGVKDADKIRTLMKEVQRVDCEG